MNNISILLDEIQELKMEREIAPFVLKESLQQEIDGKLTKVEKLLAEREKSLKNSISTSEEAELLEMERRFMKLSSAVVVVDIEDPTAKTKTDNLNDGELIQLHERIMDQQDQQLDSLAELIQKQKKIGEQIHEELEYQVDLLEDVDQRVDRTMDRLNSSTRRINNFLESSSDSKGNNLIDISFLHDNIFSVSLGRCDCADQITVNTAFSFFYRKIFMFLETKPLLLSYTRQGQIPHLVSSTQKYRILPAEQWITFPFDCSVAEYCSFKPDFHAIVTTHDINRQKKLPTLSTPKGFAFIANSGNQVNFHPSEVIELVSRLKPNAIILADPSVSIYTADEIKSPSQDRKLHKRWISWLHDMMVMEVDKWVCVTGTTPTAIMHSSIHINEEFHDKLKVYGMVLPVENDASYETKLKCRANLDSFLENTSSFGKPRMVMGMSNFELIVYAVANGVDIIDDSWLEPLTSSGRAINLSFSNGIVEIIDFNPVGTRATRIYPKEEFKTSKDTISQGCPCKTCKAGHTKAYLHHLLCVNDMCAFVLLAQHNYYMFDTFIEEIRSTIKLGKFDEIAKKWL